MDSRAWAVVVAGALALLSDYDQRGFDWTVKKTKRTVKIGYTDHTGFIEVLDLSTPGVVAVKGGHEVVTHQSNLLAHLALRHGPPQGVNRRRHPKDAPRGAPPKPAPKKTPKVKIEPAPRPDGT